MQKAWFSIVIASIIIVVWFPSSLGAQAVTTSRLEWDQPAANQAAAQAYTYKVYADGATTGAVLSNVTCATGATTIVCSAAFPSFTPGAHTLTLTAGNTAGDESDKSALLSFTFVVKPGTPAGLRVK